MTDLTTGEKRDLGTSEILARYDLPAADVLIFTLADGGKVIARPSGTEPKIKFYLELVAQAHSPAAVAETRARLEDEGQALRRTLMDELGLT